MTITQDPIIITLGGGFMFGTFRMIFWVIMFLAGIAFLKKFKMLYKRLYVTLFGILILILWTLSMLFPIENLFITFSSPEKSYNYVNSEEVKIVVSGKISNLVIGKGHDYVYLIVPKTEEGWKIGRGLDVKMIPQQYYEGIVIGIYQYKNTKDYYVEVEDINGEQCTLKDNRNSHFEILEHNLTEDKTGYRYYAYVYDIDDSYALNVNGKTLSLKDHE